MSRRIPLVALLTATVVAAVALAPASAAGHAVDTDRFVAASAVKITGSGFDFGGSGFAVGAPTSSGELEWWMKDGEPTPSLAGTLHLNDVEGACARMRLDYLTSGGVTLITKYGGDVCVDDDRHHTFSVSLSPYGNTKIGKVKISLQKLFASGGWKAVGSKTVPFGPYAASAKITTDGADFGNGTFVGSGPTGSGSLTWSYSNAAVHARLGGSLHLNKMAGTCARMKVDYRDAAGTLLGTDVGGSVCAPDNGHHEWSVDLGSFSHGDIVEATVRLQLLGSDGDWRNAGRSSHRFSTESRVVLSGGHA
jgi:hypothetical protein